jgi:CBS domain-containing protein
MLLVSRNARGKLRMTLIRYILDAKGYDIWSVRPDTSVYVALQLMAEKNIGAVVVMDRGELVGIFSERDYARKVILQGKSSQETKVGEIMTREVIGLGVNHTVEHSMALMTELHFRHLPIFDGDELIGIISIGDVVKSIIEDQEFMIDQLESYIRSG